jgi:hypothetical protein
MVIEQVTKDDVIVLGDKCSIFFTCTWENMCGDYKWKCPILVLKTDVFPNSLIDSNINLKWKQQKNKELGHAP